MRTVLFVAMLTISGVACAADVSGAKVVSESIEVGAGKTVGFGGKPLPLEGTAVQLGKPLPSAMLTGLDMGGVNLGQSKGKVRIISVVPSVDTAVCEEQTHQLSEKTNLDKNVELITVSMDLPFAQKRFSKEAKIDNVTFLSDYKSSEFGINNGVLVKPLHLLARGLIVTDKENIVRHMQFVPDLTTLPDMSVAAQIAKDLQ